MAKAKPKARAKTSPKSPKGPKQTHKTPIPPTEDWHNDPPPETGDVASPEPISQPNKPLRRDRWPVTDPLTRGLAEVCLKTHSQAPTNSQEEPSQTDRLSAPQAAETPIDSHNGSAQQPTSTRGSWQAPATPQTEPTDQKTDAGDREELTSLATDHGTPQAAKAISTADAGDVPLTAAVAEPPATYSLPDSLPRARARDGETHGQCWDRLRREARSAGMNRRESVAYAGRMVDQVWIAPLPPQEPEEEPPPPEPEAVEPEPDSSPIGDASEPAPIPSDQGVPGLGTIPDDWPELPDNASLQQEIAWVTANRLRVRDGTGVDLSKALSPAPSYSALSWLETSILFPAKFADISVKATAQQDDERENIRREKMAIEDVRRILAEMLEG